MIKLNSFSHYAKIIFSLTLIITCIFNFKNTPYYMCTTEKCLDSLSTNVKSMFSRAVAVACMIIEIKIILHNINGGFHEYEKRVGEYELYFPSDKHITVEYRTFSTLIAVTYIVMTLPVNALRIYLVSLDVDDQMITMFFAFMYVQNGYMCLVEIHFIVRCFGLYQKFRAINDDMTMLKSEIIVTNRYPSVLQSTEEHHIRTAARSTANDAFSSSSRRRTNKARLSAGSVEVLRMRHQFARDAFNQLNDLYGIQLALSLCVLCLLVVIDIFIEVFNISHSLILIYSWLLQYSFRFFVIVLTSHITSKQVLHSVVFHLNQFLSKLIKRLKSLSFSVSVPVLIPVL